MNKKTCILFYLCQLFGVLILFYLFLFVVGCSKSEVSREEFIEHVKEYEIGSEKVIKEFVPEKPAYEEMVLVGKTTSWGLKPRYKVGRGLDIEPGAYDIVAKGWAEFNLFIGNLEIDLDSTEKYSGSVQLNPLAVDICYIYERDCNYNYNGYKRVEKIILMEGDTLYTSYTPYSGQSISIRFEAQYMIKKVPKQEEQPEIKVQPLKVVEKVRKYSNHYKCYINGEEVIDCKSLNYYDDIIKMFN